MRLSKKHRELIEYMSERGYVWLSNLTPNGIMRFRNRTKKGFKGYIKVDGLTFLTPRVANEIEAGVKHDNEKRLTIRQQLTRLQDELVDLEKELFLSKEGCSLEKLKEEVSSNEHS